MRDLHSRDDQECVRWANLVPELTFELVVAEGIVFRNTEILPVEVLSRIQKSNQTTIVVAVVPRMADEEPVSTRAQNALPYRSLAVRSPG